MVYSSLLKSKSMREEESESERAISAEVVHLKFRDVVFRHFSPLFLRTAFLPFYSTARLLRRLRLKLLSTSSGWCRRKLRPLAISPV